MIHTIIAWASLAVEVGLKIKVVKFGRPAFSEYERMVEVYQKRLKPLCRFEQEVLRVNEARRSLEAEEKILQQCGPHEIVIAMDERGESLKTPSFSKMIKDYQDYHECKQITFVIGGPYGLSPEFRGRSTKLLKLSDFVVTSDLAWLLLVEQIYRAYTLIQGIPYHHE